jgi:hypothetical protein
MRCCLDSNAEAFNNYQKIDRFGYKIFGVKTIPGSIAAYNVRKLNSKFAAMTERNHIFKNVVN